MIKEDLSTWFDDSKGGGTWVDISRTDDDGEHPECGENTDKQGKAKCVPKKKAKKLSQKEKDRLVRRKRDKDTDSQSPDNASSDPSDQRKNESAMRSITEDEENEPKDEDLWQDVLAVTKGEKDSVSANGETVEAPNDGDGFDVYPSAYCVPKDNSQALTKNGWKSYDSLSTGQKILGYDRVSDTLKWTKIERLHSFEEEHTYNLYTEGFNFSLECTENHKHIISYLDDWQEEIKEIEETYSLIRRLREDDSFTFSKAKEKKSSIQGHWERYKNLDYRDYVDASKNNVASCKTYKELPKSSGNLIVAAELDESYEGGEIGQYVKYESNPIQMVLNMGKEELKSFLYGSIMCDGWQGNISNNCVSYGFRQVNEKNTEAVKLAAFLTGHKVFTGKGKRSNEITDLRISSKRHIGCNSLKFEPTNRLTEVWCPETKFGTWVVKQNDTITVTGNSNGWATKMYNKLGGEWKTVDENVTKKAIKLGLMGEDLDQWFDEEWVDISETDEDGNHPPCGETHDTPERMENPEENYPKCVPKSKAKDMTEKEKEELVRKKQKSVNQDDADQSSEDGDSDEPTYTSSDPNEHFLKQNKTTMNESTLRSIIREEIKEARVGRNQNMADTGYPEIVKRTKALMNRPVVGIDTNRRGDVYVMKFQGSMRSGISIAAFEQKGIQITSVSYEDGIITLRVRNR